VDETLDFARGRLGGGSPTRPWRRDDLRLGPAPDPGRAARVHPDRAIEAEHRRLGPLSCDARRLGQLLSNLVGRARPTARRSADPGGATVGAVTLDVAYGGEPLPPDGLERLFEPFAGRQAGDRSLGLGLYIAAEIARAHGGDLTAEAEPGGTRLTLTLPLAEARDAHERGAREGALGPARGPAPRDLRAAGQPTA
jgi:signal transduction histidine kinase